MTPGTKVRTKVSVRAAFMPFIPAGAVGLVVANLPGLKRPIEVAFPGQFKNLFYRSDELETIE